MNILFNKYRDIKIIVLSSLLIIVLTCLLIISIFYKFDFSDSYNGIVRLEDDYYVYILVNDNDIQNIRDKKLVLNKQNVDYTIIKIDADYTITQNGPLKGMCLKIDLDDKDKINNNILNLKFVHKQTILKKLKEML